MFLLECSLTLFIRPSILPSVYLSIYRLFCHAHHHLSLYSIRCFIKEQIWIYFVLKLTFIFPCSMVFPVCDVISQLVTSEEFGPVCVVVLPSVNQRCIDVILWVSMHAHISLLHFFIPMSNDSRFYNAYFQGSCTSQEYANQ